MIEVGYVKEVTATQIKLKLTEVITQDIIYRNGLQYEMPKLNQYLKIHYLDIEIIVQIESEAINELNDVDLNKEPLEMQRQMFERILHVKVIGYFSETEDGKKQFKIGPKFSPIVFNKVSLLNENEISLIVNIDQGVELKSISIGKSIINDSKFEIPLDKFFNSHLAIFGNTGSGKSNTLTKLYTELFKQYNTGTSKFVFIDFNGEYQSDTVLTSEKKKVKCSTTNSNQDKIPFNEQMLKDKEIMSVLYNATEKTQKPFLGNVLSSWNIGSSDIKDYLINCLSKVFGEENNLDANVETLISRILAHINTLIGTEYKRNPRVQYHTRDNYYYYNGYAAPHESKIKSDRTEEYCFINKLLVLNDNEISFDDIEMTNINVFDELLLRLELKLLSSIVHNNDRYEFINPLINSVESTNRDLKSVFEFSQHDIEESVIVYSLRDCNQGMKKIIPLILAKKEYNLIKSDDTIKSIHFIIDEAHNILSEQSAREGEGWKDYRLETFEEIIKEGRKFGFFITLSSQRPSDISSTLVSQIHNFLIHKLVNDRDLLMVRNVVSTLSKKEYEFIPQMGQGMCVVSGTRFAIPQIIQVDNLEDEERPDSDDIDLEWVSKLGV